jgi:hypothetical protein
VETTPLTARQQHRLGLKLRKILTGELFLSGKLHEDVYVWEEGLFKKVLHAGIIPTKDQIGYLLGRQHREAFVGKPDEEVIDENLHTALIRVTRAISVGDPKANGMRSLKLMALNLEGLDKNPHNDDVLMGQFQGTQNISSFLMENKKLQSPFFQEMSKENFHFTVLQPVLSSILLLGFLQSLHLFHEREIETLFLTSFFKDVGMGIIPESRYNTKGLSLEEQAIFSSHADYSHDILFNRVPLGRNQLVIIKNHHFLNERLKKIVSKEKFNSSDPEAAFGIESTLVAVMDILVAMTSARPYRQSMSPYQALELIKKMIGEEYPHEFKALVIYLKQFYK